MKKVSALNILLLLLVLIGVFGCRWFQLSPAAIIRLKGSDTMQIIARAWAVDFMRKNSGVAVYVEGGGSATGFKALSRGTIDIALASRLIRSPEAQALSQRFGKIGLSFLVAKDALSIYLNRDNPVGNLTLQQLKVIFTGQAANWLTVGGRDAPIQVIIRPPTSGTYFYLKEHVLRDRAYAATALTIPTTSAIVHFVARHPNAVGYGGLAYGLDIKHCRINGVPATEEEVRKGRYPLTRYLYLYTVDKPQGAIRDFVDYVLSPAGQKIVADVGYISIWLPEK